MDKNHIQINLKPDPELHKKFADLCAANTRSQIDQFRYMVERDWGLMIKDQQSGDEPKTQETRHE
jgi:hypothetical protein